MQETNAPTPEPSPATTQRNRYGNTGKPTGRPRGRAVFSPLERLEARQMVEAGFTYAATSSKLGIPASSLRRWHAQEFWLTPTRMRALQKKHGVKSAAMAELGKGEYGIDRARKFLEIIDLQDRSGDPVDVEGSWAEAVRHIDSQKAQGQPQQWGGIRAKVSQKTAEIERVDREGVEHAPSSIYENPVNTPSPTNATPCNSNYEKIVNTPAGIGDPDLPAVSNLEDHAFLEERRLERLAGILEPGEGTGSGEGYYEEEFPAEGKADPIKSIPKKISGYQQTVRDAEQAVVAEGVRGLAYRENVGQALLTLSQYANFVVQNNPRAALGLMGQLERLDKWAERRFKLESGAGKGPAAGQQAPAASVLARVSLANETGEDEVQLA